jgi:hypothetical protein
MPTISRASYWLRKLLKLRFDRARGDPARDKALLMNVEDEFEVDARDV